MNIDYNEKSNGVNELLRTGEYLSPSRTCVMEQAQPSRYPTAPPTRCKWSVEDNRTAMECYMYIMSNPSKRGYRQRMLQLWESKGKFKVSEQRLADKGRTIKQNQWFTDIELEELTRTANSNHQTNPTLENTENISLHFDAITELNETAGVEDHSARRDSTPESLHENNDQGLGLSEEEIELYHRILRLASDSNRSRLPVLKQFKKKAILAEFRKVNHVLDQITSNDIDHSNQ